MKSRLGKSWAIIGIVTIIMMLTSVFSSFAMTNVTAEVELQESDWTKNGKAKTKSVDVSLMNTSGNILYTPIIRVVIDSIGDSRITVPNADGTTDDGKPYFEYTAPGKLLPDERTDFKEWIFQYPKKKIAFGHPLIYSSSVWGCTDVDGDGYFAEADCGIDQDCNDDDSAINPSATEVCDLVDNNCDGQIDEGVTTTFYLDDDEDGFGDANSTIQACSVPVHYVENSSDCDDTDPWFWLTNATGDCSLKAYTDCPYMERYNRACHPPIANSQSDRPVYKAQGEFGVYEEGHKWKKDKFGYLAGQHQPGAPNDPLGSGENNKRHLQSIQYFNMDGVEGEKDWREFLVVSMSDEHDNKASINMISIGGDSGTKFGTESGTTERVFNQWTMDRTHFKARVPGIPRGYNHPGGSQMIGEYLFIALEDFDSNVESATERMRPKIGVWEIGRLANQDWAYLDFRYLVDPYYGHDDLFNEYTADDSYQEFPHWEDDQIVPKNISTVAVTKLEDKTYLLAACVDAGCKKISFLKSRKPDQLNDDPEFIFIDEWEYDGELLYPDWDERHGDPVIHPDYNFWTVCPPQNGNFIVQDDGEIFLTFFGMRLTSNVFSNCGWGNGSNTIYTYKVNFTKEREIKLEYISSGSLSNETYICDPLGDIDNALVATVGLNFEAGAGVWIAPNGVTSRISLLATEHYNFCGGNKSRWGVTGNWDGP